MLFFNGAPDRIGLVGIVIDDVMAVPSRSLCIIRPYAVPPVCLFLYLRTAEIRREIQSLARANSFDRKSFVNIESLRWHEIGDVFVREMKNKDVEEKARLLVNYYMDCRKELDDRIYSIQRDLLNAWPED